MDTTTMTTTSPGKIGATCREISIRNLAVTFMDRNSDEPIHALRNVSLEIDKGEFVALLGPSGCGKTTLLRAVGDLQEPSFGDVEINGMTAREARENRKFGMVFQTPVLFDWRTVRRNICMPMEVIGLDPRERTRRVDQTLELVGLSKFGRKYPHQLSGGMQQRVGIARALALDPEILLMDEPFSALDEFTKERLHMDLLDIWRRTNKSILFVTHNIQEAVFLADRVVVLSPHPGRVSAIVDIGLPRPRDLEVKGTPEFATLVNRVRHSFEGV
ncbi:MAG: ABC transporter ATP-binding protein [Spirochaetota bacterium]